MHPEPRPGFRLVAGCLVAVLSLGGMCLGPVHAQTPPPPPRNGPAEPPEEAEPVMPPAADLSEEEETPPQPIEVISRRNPAPAPAVSASQEPLPDGIPARPPLSRYQGLMDKMPFGEATADLNPGKQPSFAQNLFLAGIGGEERIYVSTKDRTGHFRLEPEKPHDGIELVKVNWSDVPGGTTVTVRKSGEVAVLEFDQATVSGPPPVQPNGAKPATPNRPTANARSTNNAARDGNNRTPPQRPTRLIRTRRIRSTP